jgi:hypothetical protein
VLLDHIWTLFALVSQQVTFSLCKHSFHWLTGPYHGLPRVTGPIIALVVSSILVERSSLGTSPHHDTKLILKTGPEITCAEMWKIKTIESGRRR